jgi:hypothetical protein
MKTLSALFFLFFLACSVQAQTIITKCGGIVSDPFYFNANIKYTTEDLPDTLSSQQGTTDLLYASQALLLNVPVYAYQSQNVNGVLMYVRFDYVQFELWSHPQICFATPSLNSDLIEIKVDSSNMIGYDRVKLEWESLGSWVVIDSLDKFVSLSEVTNKSANTTSHQFRTTVEGCQPSAVHRTIHLQMSSDDLVWNAYEGIDSEFFHGYFIWKRDVGSSDFIKIDSTSSTTYTDASWQSGDSYLVEALRTDGCNTAVWSGKVEELSQGSIVSNIYSDVVGLPEFQLPEITMSNPSDHLALKLNREAHVKLYDLTGREVHDYGHTDKVEDHTVGAGLYLIKATDRSNYQIVKRLIIQ